MRRPKMVTPLPTNPLAPEWATVQPPTFQAAPQAAAGGGGGGVPATALGADVNTPFTSDGSTYIVLS